MNVLYNLQVKKGINKEWQEKKKTNHTHTKYRTQKNLLRNRFVCLWNDIKIILCLRMSKRVLVPLEHDFILFSPKHEKRSG